MSDSPVRPLSTLLDAISDGCREDLGMDPDPAKRFAESVREWIRVHEDARRELGRLRWDADAAADDEVTDADAEVMAVLVRARAERIAHDLARAMVHVRLWWREFEAETLHVAASAMELAAAASAAAASATELAPEAARRARRGISRRRGRART